MMLLPAPNSVIEALRAGILTAALLLGIHCANAFESDTHESVTARALSIPTGPSAVDTDALQDIIGNFYLGTGNLGSNLYQFNSELHFDNNASPAAVCANANYVWTTFMREILAGARTTNAPDFDQLRNGPAARAAVGRIFHALQDFYAHSNWIELGNRLPAPLFPICNAAALPPGLQTGYFAVAVDQLISGCPRGGPPPPFTYCHEALNKDELFGHGLDAVPGVFDTAVAPGIPVPASTPGARPMNYHDYAARLAAQHTESLYTQIRDEVRNTAQASHPNVLGPCVARKLFQVGFATTCLDLSGNWRVTSSPTGSPPVGLPFALLNSPANKITGWITSSECGDLNLSINRTTPGTFVGIVTSCTASTGGCPSQINLPLRLAYSGPNQIMGELTAIDLEWRNNQCSEVSRTVLPFVLQR